MEPAQAGQQELKEAIWKYAGQGVLLLAVFLAGGVTGFLLWGDAPRLRVQVEDLQATVSAVRAERENANYEISRLTREGDRLARELAGCREQAAQAEKEAPAEEE